MHRQVLIGGPEVAHVGQAQLGGQRLAVVQRLAEQHAGIQEQHRDRAVDLGGHVQQDRRFRPERRHQGQLVAEVLDRGLQDLLRLGVAQPGVQDPRVDGADRLVQQRAQFPVPRSTKAGVRSSAARW